MGNLHCSDVEMINLYLFEIQIEPYLHKSFANIISWFAIWDHLTLHFLLQYIVLQILGRYKIHLVD
jgi:hypothetical protein